MTPHPPCPSMGEHQQSPEVRLRDYHRSNLLTKENVSPSPFSRWLLTANRPSGSWWGLVSLSHLTFFIYWRHFSKAHSMKRDSHSCTFMILKAKIARPADVHLWPQPVEGRGRHIYLSAFKATLVCIAGSRPAKATKWDFVSKGILSQKTKLQKQQKHYDRSWFFLHETGGRYTCLLYPCCKGCCTEPTIGLSPSKTVCVLTPNHHTETPISYFLVVPF